MSLYIFVLCIEHLLQAIVEVVNEEKWKLVCFGNMSIFQLLFVDEFILFGYITTYQASIVIKVKSKSCSCFRYI